MQNKFAASQIVLHWLTLILLILAYGTVQLSGLGEWKPWQGYVIAVTHITAGATVVVAMLLRLLLRTIKPTPAIIPTPKRWHSALAHLSHSAIYALFIALPSCALISRFYYGSEWSLYGIAMPYAEVASPELSKKFIGWHKTLAPLGYWLIGLHTAAALGHHYLLNDNTLRRMLPWRNKP